MRVAVIAAIWGTLLLAGLLLWFVHDMPRPDAPLAQIRRPAAAVLAGDGSLLATQGDLFGEVLRLREMPAALPEALIAIEDRRFRHHFGVDPFGIARAFWANVTAGDVVQGGSTLTQQLAKNLFLTPARSTRRKVQEALLALWLERRFSKDELLEIYLNRVYLGGGAHGVDAAARLFFNVSARRVNLWQAAMLAGLPQAPSRTNPRSNPEGAMARAAEVLRAMTENGVINETQRAQAVAAMTLPPRPGTGGGWFGDWVMETIADRMPDLRDVTIRATLDPRWQSAAESRLRAMLEREGTRGNIAQGAVVVLDAGTGAVRAMVGGRDYRAGPFNRAVHARRQPGSAFKPIYYLAALERGALPGDMVADGPISRGGWSPGNGNWRSRGVITIEEHDRQPRFAFAAGDLELVGAGSLDIDLRAEDVEPVLRHLARRHMHVAQEFDRGDRAEVDVGAADEARQLKDPSLAGIGLLFGFRGGGRGHQGEGLGDLGFDFSQAGEVIVVEALDRVVADAAESAHRRPIGPPERRDPVGKRRQDLADQIAVENLVSARTGGAIDDDPEADAVDMGEVETRFLAIGPQHADVTPVEPDQPIVAHGHRIAGGRLGGRRGDAQPPAGRPLRLILGHQRNQGEQRCPDQQQASPGAADHGAPAWAGTAGVVVGMAP